MWITGRRALGTSGSGNGKSLYDLLPHDLGNIPFPGNTAHGENPQSPLGFWDLFPLFPLFPVPSRGGRYGEACTKDDADFPFGTFCHQETWEQWEHGNSSGMGLF